MHQPLEFGYWPDTPIDIAIAVDGPTFTIGDLAREFGVTLRALRFYESRHLLRPRRNGYMRIYRQGDRERLALILRGKKLGFSLDDIANMLGGGAGAVDEAQTALNLSREKCVDQINLLEGKKRQIETALAELRLAFASWGERFPRRAEARAL